MSTASVAYKFNFMVSPFSTFGDRCLAHDIPLISDEASTPYRGRSPFIVVHVHVLLLVNDERGRGKSDSVSTFFERPQSNFQLVPGG